MNLLQAIDDPNLFRPWFKDRSTWQAWTAFLCALFALPMTPEQLKIYQSCTNRTAPPGAPLSEAWLVCGRRAGKSFILALTAVYLATFRDYNPHLAPGEKATILIVSADRKQSRVIFRYIKALLQGVPMLARLIERETAESIYLLNKTVIEVGTASHRSTRGYSFAAVLLDELSFFRSEDAASPDTEIIVAIKPGMATLPGSMLLCASSPYSRRGELWNAYNRYFGKENTPLVWQAETRRMNHRSR
jgi:hypothetical protein